MCQLAKDKGPVYLLAQEPEFRLAEGSVCYLVQSLSLSAEAVLAYSKASV